MILLFALTNLSRSTISWISTAGFFRSCFSGIFERVDHSELACACFSRWIQGYATMEFPAQSGKCQATGANNIRRRNFLRHGFALAGVAFAWNALKRSAQAQGTQISEPKTAEQALAELKAGNRRYAGFSLCGGARHFSSWPSFAASWQSTIG
jgi:hypothetical protein